MTPLFQFVQNSTAYIPWMGTNEDGSPQLADGTRYFDIEQAITRSGHTREALLEAWRMTFAQFTGEILDVSPGDSDAIRMREAFLERAFRGLTPEQIEDVRIQAEALGYSFETGECWATVVEDENGTRGVCVAKLEALQARVLKSGLFSGRKGPVEFQDAVGAWTTVWSDPITPPHACRMTLCRHGVEHGQEYLGLWSEMASDNWYFAKRPSEALEKCVEAKGLRKLFRDVTGNVYIPEELPGRKPRPSPGSGPKLATYDDAPEESPDITTETGARALMAKMGGAKPLQDKIIAGVRAQGLDDMSEPEVFWNRVLDAAQKVLRGARRAR